MKTTRETRPLPMNVSASVDSQDSVRRASFRLGAIYWTGVFLTSSLLWGVVGTPPLASAVPKLVLFSFAGLLTFGMSGLLLRLRGGTLGAKAALCFLMSILAAPLYCLIDHAIYLHVVQPPPEPFDWKDFGYNLIYGTSLFFGWSCLFVALIYNFEVIDRERRLHALREEALDAQMRALHYQINPHFLFNTLNAIAGLIEEGAARQAERMVLSLSGFLRTTLTLDPTADVSLAQELALQLSYLDIERERFSDRMRVRVDVPAGLTDILVPTLILQPLVENAVKHGVGSLPGQVEVRIQASEAAGTLSLSVENDYLPGGCGARPGAGIGLRNVRERLQTRFGAAARCDAAPLSAGRYRVVVHLPSGRA